MSEEEAERAFEVIRFAKTEGEPHCVWCDCEVAYRITRTCKNRKTGEERKRTIFKCKKCPKQFSVTSGTGFHGRKLSFKKIMLATLLWVNGEAGHAGLRLKRDIKCNHKTGWQVYQRLRHTMTSYATSELVEGDFEMDSTSFGGSIRKANEAKDRQKQPRRDESKVTTVSILRERKPGGRVVPFLGNEAKLARAIGMVADIEARPFVDEHAAWNALFAIFPEVKQIKHKERYSDGEGTSTNLAESYFSRFKRMYRGTYLCFSSQYAHVYNGEGAWRERHSRISNGEKFVNVLAGALHHPPTPMRGYYQRTRYKEAA
jgi:transposase-like protein